MSRWPVAKHERYKTTAQNSAFLRNVKRQFNHKIYARVLHLENADGREASMHYLDQFTRPEYRQRIREGLEGFGRALGKPYGMEPERT